MKSMSSACPVFSGLPEVAVRRLGSLAPGGMFGAMLANKFEPFSIVAASAQVECYGLCDKDMRQLPSSLLHLMRDVLEHQKEYRVNRCDTPAGNILGMVPKTIAGYGGTMQKP